MSARGGLARTKSSASVTRSRILDVILDDECEVDIFDGAVDQTNGDDPDLTVPEPPLSQVHDVDDNGDNDASLPKRNTPSSDADYATYMTTHDTLVQEKKRGSHDLRDSERPGAVAYDAQGRIVLERGRLSDSSLMARMKSSTNSSFRTKSMRESGRGNSIFLLSEAKEVADETNLQSADPLDEEEQAAINKGNVRNSKASRTAEDRTHLCRFLAVLATVALAVGCFWGGVLFEKSQSNTNATPTDTQELPTGTANTTLVMNTELAKSLGLPTFTLSTIISDPESAQARAYSWLIEDLEFSAENGPHHPEWKQIQRFALAVVYYATGGESWKLRGGWLSHDLDECHDWFFRKQISSSAQMGLAAFYTNPNSRGESEKVLSPCGIHNNVEGSYKIMSLTDNNLEGTLPPEILLFSNLKYLDVSANEYLGGRIPTEIGLMKDLTRFFANRGAFEGWIPSEIGLMESLQVIDVGFNTFITGPIPSEIGRLGPSLKIFSTQRAGVTGVVPTELFQLTNLEEYLIHGSLDLVGGTLAGIGALTNLQTFVAHDVPYKSAIPSEVGLLTNLLEFNVYNCHMTGTIPSEIWSLASLFRMDIDHNYLTGPFPQNIGKLTRLQTLYADANYLTGALGSKGWEDVPNLTVLHVGSGANDTMGSFGGTIPTELGYLTSMTSLGLHTMNLSGTVPTELGLMTAMGRLLLHNTRLEGSIPDELANLSLMEALTVSNTQLNGSIPVDLCSKVKEVTMPCLELFFTQNNLCTGFEVHDFSCKESQLCGCACSACE